MHYFGCSWRKFAWSKSEREKKFCLSTCLAQADAFGIWEKPLSMSKYRFIRRVVDIMNSTVQASSEVSGRAGYCCVHWLCTQVPYFGCRYNLIVRLGHFPHEKLNYVCGKVKQPWNICANYVCGFRQKVYVAMAMVVAVVVVVVALTINHNVTRIRRRRRRRRPRIALIDSMYSH